MVGPPGLEPGTKGEVSVGTSQLLFGPHDQSVFYRSIHYRHNIETGSEIRAGDAEPGLASDAKRQARLSNKERPRGVHRGRCGPMSAATETLCAAEGLSKSSRVKHL
jgi:hypothetical protein